MTTQANRLAVLRALLPTAVPERELLALLAPGGDDFALTITKVGGRYQIYQGSLKHDGPPILGSGTTFAEAWRQAQMAM